MANIEVLDQTPEEKEYEDYQKSLRPEPNGIQKPKNMTRFIWKSTNMPMKVDQPILK
jgi:hypothetical protein